MTVVRLGLAGLGTVGQGLLEILTRDKEIIEARSGVKFEIAYIFDRSYQSKKEIIGSIPASDDFIDLFKDPQIDILIELLGGMDPAKEIIYKSIEQNIPVVTANKALLAKHGNEILEMAHNNATDVAFEAAIAGAVPIIKNMRRALIANRFEGIYGILNGTCNFIITQMENKGMDYEQALALAQKSGFAEADPSFDVDGLDAAQKLAILAALAFDTKIQEDAVLVEGIRSINKTDLENARNMGMVVRLLAIARNNPIQMKVRPVMINKNHMIASVQNENNAIFLSTSNSGSHLVVGCGAGAKPTAAAVISDLVYIIKNNPKQTERWISGKTVPQLFTDYNSRYYLRFNTEDRPGVLAEIATILAKFEISIASVHQNEGIDTVDLVIVTHHASEIQMGEAINKINDKEFIKAPTVMIQIEENIPE